MCDARLKAAPSLHSLTFGIPRKFEIVEGPGPILIRHIGKITPFVVATVRRWIDLPKGRCHCATFDSFLCQVCQRGVPSVNVFYTNERPGLGVTLDLKQVKLISEVTQTGRRQFYLRPDGSVQHW